jgi:hypothetical protein
MGSLSNLYISQSYQSLIHFGNDSSASATLIEVQDGVGNGLGVYLNTLGELKATTSISSSTIEATNLVIKNKIELTGSIDVDGPVTASNAFIENNLIVSGTLFANKVVTLIESSSIIYSSGSNILGDETSDIQTLIGLVRMSGSSQLTGSMGITDDLNVLGNISSSTISGIGNVTLYSQSVDNRLDIVEATASLYIPFSQSVDSRLDGLEATASYLNTTFSQSVDFRLDELENWSSSLQTNFVTTTELTLTRSLIEGEMTVTASLLQNNINTKLNTSSFNAYTQSTDNRINVLSSFTGSYATTGSNTFSGNQTINGTLLVSSSMVYSGSVRGRVITLNVTSQTASMDLSLGNFFSLTLPTSSTTYLNPTNIQPGETVQLLVKQQSLTGSLNYPSSLLFPTGSDYSASVFANSQDILSFVTFDTASIYAVSIKNLI